MRDFAKGLWKTLKGPVEELIAHFFITILTLLSIRGVELILDVLHLSTKPLPVGSITFADWMFDLEVLAVSLISVVGVYRALKAVLRG